MSDIKEDNVVVTGFGLFRGIKSNPSWDAINDESFMIDRPHINVITKRIQVEYNAVDKEVEQLWGQYQPILMVHVGLAALTKNIRLECRARHGPYIQDDVVDHAPHKDLRQYDTKEDGIDNVDVGKAVKEKLRFTCKPCQFDSSKPCMNMERVCDVLNKLYEQKLAPIPFKCSHDAGLYVCEYIYHRSLSICDRAVFIHVPDVSEEITLEKIRSSLKIAIESLVDEIRSVKRG